MPRYCPWVLYQRKRPDGRVGGCWQREGEPQEHGRAAVTLSDRLSELQERRVPILDHVLLAETEEPVGAKHGH